MLQGAAANHNARSTRMGVVLSFNSQATFKIGVTSFTTTSVDNVRPNAVVENSNAWKGSGLTLVWVACT